MRTLHLDLQPTKMTAPILLLIACLTLPTSSLSVQNTNLTAAKQNGIELIEVTDEAMPETTIVETTVTKSANLDGCFPEKSRANPSVKTTNGRSCFFPFRYRGKVYTDCAPHMKPETSAWCATSCNLERDRLFADCRWSRADLSRSDCANLTRSTKVPLMFTATGKQCMLPFVYEGKCHIDCVTTATTWCGVVSSLVYYPQAFDRCVATKRELDGSSCTTLSKSAVTLHPLTVTKMNQCVFPFFYYTDKHCHSDCTNSRSSYYWCATRSLMDHGSTEFAKCKYMGNLPLYTRELRHGIYTIHSYCEDGFSSPLCNATVTVDSIATDSVVQLRRGGGGRYSTWEVLPQPNDTIIVRLSPRYKEVPLEDLPSWRFLSTPNHSLALYGLDNYNTNTRFTLQPYNSTTSIFTLSSVIENSAYPDQMVGFTPDSQDSGQLVRSYLPFLWNFKFVEEVKPEYYERKTTTLSALTKVTDKVSSALTKGTGIVV